MADRAPSVRERRRLRRGLVRFLDLVGLHVRAGYDLGFAWPETWRAIAPELPPDLRLALRPGDEPTTRLLARLSAEYPDPAHRIWFAAMGELYASGAGIADAVQAVAETLRGEQAQDLEAHCRELPTRVNILLILFFFPAVAALLFVPLLAEILGVFQP